MRKLLLILAILFSLITYSQDTLTVLQYNLLWYGQETDWCDDSNNNLSEKDQYLRTILGYAKPDIFSVNEMSKSPVIHQHLLDQVLNTNGVNYFQKANFLSEAETDIVNMLYFNTQKLALHSHFIAQNYIRDIDVYKLYHLSDQLAAGDTTFVICVVAHLKSSSGEDNEEKRRVMASNTMNWLDEFDDNNNYLMMGDFNVYSPTEPAFQEFLNYENPSLRFIDPIDQIGEWHNNYNYAQVHTQSTHSSGNGCPSTGGMDDRFDVILISNSISTGSKNVTYLDDSYWAVGQDGMHFNKSLVDSPTNTTVPSDVLNALYNNSDHLPVTLRLVVTPSISGLTVTNTEIRELIVVNPVADLLQFNIQMKRSAHVKIELLDVSGKVLKSFETELNQGTNKLEKNVSYLNSGMYFLKVSDSDKFQIVKKIIKR